MTVSLQVTSFHMSHERVELWVEAVCYDMAAFITFD